MKNVFLQWLLLISVMLTSTLIAYRLGYLSYVFENDASHICAIIAVIFTATTAHCGVLAWKFSAYSDALKNAQTYAKNEYAQTMAVFKHRLQTSMEFEELCVKLGLLGTVLGFLMMFTDIKNPSTDQLKYILAGLATALLTTMAGLVASICIFAQNKLIENGMELFDIKNDKVWPDESA
ncbi:MotA/TolQ/ExbB proton channel family protein [bacterium]|nr:MotA/TolQ/ExbB proton channel family protein [bacterium]MCI0566209.1 MotA/TolQ/ExbB proton channel family protein [bacterium]MCI0679764.1 MotA/TolQ/ExbB proton channel family protein [bacterium]